MIDVDATADRASFSPFAQRTQQFVKESLGQAGEKVSSHFSYKERYETDTSSDGSSP